jgi:hypothetical protein
MPDLDRSAWTATASSYYEEYSGDLRTTPDKAIDGINMLNSTFWISDAGFPQYLEIDMGADHEITYVKCFKAKTRFYSPIFWAQDHPSYVAVEFYTGGGWIEVARQVWPNIGDPHYIYIEPTFPPTLLGGFVYVRWTISTGALTIGLL